MSEGMNSINSHGGVNASPSQGMNSVNGRGQGVIDASPSQGMRSIHGRGAIGINLSLNLNSGGNSASHYQTIPMFGQLGLHPHVAEGRIRRSNLTTPLGIRSHVMSNPHNSGGNNVNINIFMGRNPPINYNNPQNNNNNVPLPLENTNFLSSSSTIEQASRNRAINVASSKFKHPFFNLSSNHIPTTLNNNNLEGNQSAPQLTKSFLHHASSSTTTLTAGKTLPISTSMDTCNREIIPTAIPITRSQVMAMASPYQGHSQTPSQTSVFQPETISNLGSLSLLPKHFNNDKYCHQPLLPTPTIEQEKHSEINFGLGNGKSHGSDEIQSQPSDTPRSATTNSAMRLVSDQVSDPNTNGRQRLRYQPAVKRYKSQPYIKHGPYTCPMCHVVYTNGNAYSAHFHHHYKNESPIERQKRREGKMKTYLRIAESSEGLTVIPQSLQLSANLLGSAKVSDKNVTGSSEGEGVTAVRVKEEVIDD